jgi:hypothetical protein
LAAGLRAPPRAEAVLRVLAVEREPDDAAEREPPVLFRAAPERLALVRRALPLRLD